MLDTQRDHAALVDDCMRLLAPGGLLVFSTNAQRLKIGGGVLFLPRVEMLDIIFSWLPLRVKGSQKTTPNMSALLILWALCQSLSPFILVQSFTMLAFYGWGAFYERESGCSGRTFIIY